MKKRNPACALLMMLCILLFLTACQKADTEPAAQKDIYRFEDYENSEVFDIEQIDLAGNLAQACTTWRFTYLSDGYRIKAYISIPNEAMRSGRPAKCVLFNRGGNRNFSTLDDDTTAQICAVCSRIVIASQYRGGGGSEGDDQFGGDDLNDVIRLIDLCETQFSFVDMEDFCAAGTSRGGMMTYMAARQDDRIRRIMAVSAISDLSGWYEERGDMRELLREMIGASPEEDPAAYEKRSAICWYDEIKVPVLIIHSRQDARVAYSQAEELHEKLKEVTDCTFLSHDDDLHGNFHPEDVPAILEWLK